MPGSGKGITTSTGKTVGANTTQGRAARNSTAYRAKQDTRRLADQGRKVLQTTRGMNKPAGFYTRRNPPALPGTRRAA